MLLTNFSSPFRFVQTVTHLQPVGEYTVKSRICFSKKSEEFLVKAVLNISNDILSIH